MAETAGLIVGAAVIALAFKGVVDTANLFDQIIETDKSSRALTLKYEIKHWRLDLSAERAPNDSHTHDLAVKFNIMKPRYP